MKIHLEIVYKDGTTKLIVIDKDNPPTCIRVRRNSEGDQTNEQQTQAHGEEGSKGRRDSQGTRDAMKMKAPKEITVANLEVVVMPTGEVICLGKFIGWVNGLGSKLTPKEAK